MFLLYALITEGFPGGSAGKESACNAGDLGSIPGLGRSPGEEKGYPNPWVGKIPWRRERLPTSVSWPGEFHGYSSLGCKELDTA